MQAVVPELQVAAGRGVQVGWSAQQAGGGEGGPGPRLYADGPGGCGRYARDGPAGGRPLRGVRRVRGQGAGGQDQTRRTKGKRTQQPGFNYTTKYKPTVEQRLFFWSVFIQPFPHSRSISAMRRLQPKPYSLASYFTICIRSS